jgi:hypothetical protein
MIKMNLEENQLNFKQIFEIPLTGT